MKIKKIAAPVCAVIACVIFGYIIFRIVRSQSEKIQIPFKENELYIVTEVLDGDTFRVNVGKKIVTVRMLGIDTPETVDPRKESQCYGKEASDETKRLLINQPVRLELNPNREVYDKYGRYLAYVFLADGLFVNKYLLAGGFAREYTYGKPYSLQKEFRRLEKEARGDNAGLWIKCL